MKISSKQLRARPDYREPRPQFEIKELAPIQRSQNNFAHARPHHNDVNIIVFDKNWILRNFQ